MGEVAEVTEKWAEILKRLAQSLVEVDHVEEYFDPRTKKRGHKFVLFDQGDGKQDGGMLVVRVEERD